MKDAGKNLNERIQTAINKRQDAWSLSNETLYRLCREYPDHKEPKAIIAKILLIGRTYAAAIERRKLRDDMDSDNYYKAKVVPIIQHSILDDLLSELKSSPTAANILKTHNYLVNLFMKISGQRKRSLASKYLHFHFPELFYIYDSRSVKALCMLRKELGLARRNKAVSSQSDKEYEKYHYQCKEAVKAVQERFGGLTNGRPLTCREFDILLINMLS